MDVATYVCIYIHIYIYIYIANLRSYLAMDYKISSSTLMYVAIAGYIQISSFQPHYNFDAIKDLQQSCMYKLAKIHLHTCPKIILSNF